MLILGRNAGQGIRIETPEGRVVWVQITSIDRNKCRVGITADREVSVKREELLDSEQLAAMPLISAPHLHRYAIPANPRTPDETGGGG